MTTSYICKSCRLHIANSIRLFSRNSRIRKDAPHVTWLKEEKRLLQTASRMSATPSNGSPARLKDRTEASIDSQSSTSPVQSQNPFEGLRDRAAKTKQFNPIQSIAQQLRKRAGVTTETYVAYGACEKLVKECARQADYKIARPEKKNVDIPKTKDGEDLGKGDGWWYSSTIQCSVSFPMCSPHP